MDYLATLLPLVLLILLMYFFMIKPQKKREKQAKDMRDSIQPGDEIITIGGICGKVVKTKDDSIIIQVGSDKMKFEIMRWAISQVVNHSEEAVKKAKAASTGEEEPKKALPKRLKKSENEVAEEVIPAVEEAQPEEAAPAAEEN